MNDNKANLEESGLLRRSKLSGISADILKWDWIDFTI